MSKVTSEFEPNDDHKRASPKGRTRTGCLTCRRRKKKCDEKHPTCIACGRNNIECEWESAASLMMPRRRNRRPRLPEKDLPGQAQGMVNVFTVMKSDLVTRLLGHFMHASPRWLSTRTGSQRTDYLEWLYPAISESPLVFKCVLTIASTDLIKYDRGDRELPHVAVDYYGQAVSGLRTAIESEITSGSMNGESLTDYNPLAVLLLCLHEVSSADSNPAYPLQCELTLRQTQNFTEGKRILPHLNAAIFLLERRLSRTTQHSALRSFIFEIFCYFFSLAAYNFGSQLSLLQAYRIFNSPSVIGYIQSGHIMGTSQQLFVTIFRVSTLAQTLATGDESKISSAKKELNSLDQELVACQVDSGDDKHADVASLTDAVTYELYRLACRIYVTKLLDPLIPDDDDHIQFLLMDFTNQLRRLPSNSPTNSILSWPLVVAGMCATFSVHQKLIAKKLVHIHEEWQSDIFSKSLAFLRERWRATGTPKCDRGSNPLRMSDGPGAVASRAMIWQNLPIILA